MTNTNDVLCGYLLAVYDNVLPKKNDKFINPVIIATIMQILDNDYGMSIRNTFNELNGLEKFHRDIRILKKMINRMRSFTP